MNAITWEQLTEAEQEALKGLTDQQMLSTAMSIRLELLGLTQTLESEFGYEGDELTDAGRAVLAEADRANAQPPVTQEEINAYLKQQGQDPELLADAFRPIIEKAIRERQAIIDQLVAPYPPPAPDAGEAEILVDFLEYGDRSHTTKAQATDAAHSLLTRITDLEAELLASRKRESALREAVEFYANPALYVAKVTTYKTGDYDVDCELLYEGGKRAAAALQAGESEA